MDPRLRGDDNLKLIFMLEFIPHLVRGEDDKV